MSDTPKHSVSVAGIVVRDDGRILAIQRRDNQHWEPPGGVLELDETFDTGVRREILEETGIEVEVERLTGVYKNMSRGVVALVFRCRPNGNSCESSEEAQKVAWLTSDEASQCMRPAYAVRVADALFDEVATRVHDGFAVLNDQKLNST